MRLARSTHLLATVTMTAVCLAALTGCVPETPDVTTPTGKPTSTSTPSAPPKTPPVVDDATPVTITCDQLIPQQAMYDYNPNFGLLTDFTPDAGSLAATIVAAKGLACRWINQTSGETIDFAVANLTADKLTTLKNDLVMTSNSVPTYMVEGYFQVKDGVGEAQAFSDPYWITAVSAAFFEPGDVTLLMASAVANLG